MAGELAAGAYFTVGDAIEVVGLSTANGKHLNGQVGVINRSADSKGRFQVRLGKGECMVMSPENLKKMDLTIGDCVEVVGLTTEEGGELNGRVGVVVNFDPEKARWEVRIVPSPKGSYMFRRANLKNMEIEQFVKSGVVRTSSTTTKPSVAGKEIAGASEVRPKPVRMKLRAKPAASPSVLEDAESAQCKDTAAPVVEKKGRGRKSTPKEAPQQDSSPATTVVPAPSTSEPSPIGKPVALGPARGRGRAKGSKNSASEAKEDQPSVDQGTAVAEKPEERGIDSTASGKGRGKGRGRGRGRGQKASSSTTVNDEQSKEDGEATPSAGKRQADNSGDAESITKPEAAPSAPIAKRPRKQSKQATADDSSAAKAGDANEPTAPKDVQSETAEPTKTAKKQRRQSKQLTADDSSAAKEGGDAEATAPADAQGDGPQPAKAAAKKRETKQTKKNKQADGNGDDTNAEPKQDDKNEASISAEADPATPAEKKRRRRNSNGGQANEQSAAQSEQVISPSEKQPVATKTRGVAAKAKAAKTATKGDTKDNSADDAVIARADAAGLSGALRNLASRPDVAEKKFSLEVLLGALEKADGLVNKAKTSLLNSEEQ